jgi:hypothetical protein
MQLKLVRENSTDGVGVNADTFYRLSCPKCDNDATLMTEAAEFAPSLTSDHLQVTTIASCDNCRARFGLRFFAHGGSVSFSVVSSIDFDATRTQRFADGELTLERDRGRPSKKVR